MDARPGFICIARVWPDSLRAVTKRRTQIETQMGLQYHFIQGTAQQGFVSNCHGVLELSWFGAPGRPPFRLNGSFRLRCAAIIDHVAFPAQKYRVVAIVCITGDGYLALALALQVHHAHVHDGTQIGEGLHHSHVRALVVAVHVELHRHGGRKSAVIQNRFLECFE